MPKDIAVALKYRDEKGRSSKFSEPPGIILPSQYFDVIRGCGQLTPEKKLMLAVLESAVHDFQRYRLASGRRGKRIFREAHEWLTSREETGIFSFVVICHALDVDPDYISKGLSAWLPGKSGGETSEMVMHPAVTTDRRRRLEVMMTEDTFNMEVRKFLKKVGVTSQREMEKAVREAIQAGSLAGNEKLKARMKLEVEGLNLDLVIEDDIALS